jgi:hypothetical protein
MIIRLILIHKSEVEDKKEKWAEDHLEEMCSNAEHLGQMINARTSGAGTN